MVLDPFCARPSLGPPGGDAGSTPGIWIVLNGTAYFSRLACVLASNRADHRTDGARTQCQIREGRTGMVSSVQRMAALPVDPGGTCRMRSAAGPVRDNGRVAGGGAAGRRGRRDGPSSRRGRRRQGAGARRAGAPARPARPAAPPAGAVAAPAPGPMGAGKALQRALLEAMEALRPATRRRPGRADGRRGAGRRHRLLALRYVEALPAAEVQRRLAVGRSEYYREHLRASRPSPRCCATAGRGRPRRPRRGCLRRARPRGPARRAHQLRRPGAGAGGGGARCWRRQPRW